jgi:Tfp pilus assembly protein PilV
VNKRVDALRHAAGFTIIEVMVAITLLLIGVLGVATIADSANITSTTNKARVGATNLAREMIEDARTFKYAELNGDFPAPSGGVTDLQDAYNAIGITDGSASTAEAQISRRGTTYNVHVFTCILDDAHDGVRATASPDVNSAGTPYCLGSATSAATATDSNPDDARKVEVSVTWSLGNHPVNPSCRNARQTSGNAPTGGVGTACVVQSEIIANPTGGLGPGIKSITQTAPAAPNTTIEPNSTSVTLRVVTTFAAESVVWSSDDGSNGTATAAAGDTTGTLWDINWGSWGSTTPIDGSHIVTVQAFLLNAGGVPKETAVNFNRFIPQAPSQASLAGGVDTRIDGTVNTATSQPAASLNWLPVTGGDILGYTAYRVTTPLPPTGPGLTATPVFTGPTADVPVCSTASVNATSCFDAPGVAPTDLASFANHLACPASAALTDKCINYYIIPFDQKWQVFSSPLQLLRDATTCVPFPYAAGLTVPDPPNSVAPLTSSSGWPTARAGCPSAMLNINYTQAVQNPQPNGATTPSSCTTDAGQPVIGWTPPTNPGNYVSYRIYRDPPSTPAPGYNDPATTINFGTPTAVSSFKDPNPTNGTDHHYYVTVVDDKFQESAPLKIDWSAGGCP